MFRPEFQGRVRLSAGACARRDASIPPRDHGGGDGLGSDAPAGGREERDQRRGQEAGAAALRRCGDSSFEGFRAGRGERPGARHPRRGRVLPGDPGRADKSAPGDGKRSAADRELAIQQIVSRAVVSTEIVDIMKAAGLQSPDISILSDDFLAEVRDTPKKNLAIEALKKLINGEVRSQAKSNVTQSKAFTERLEAAIARYHANALTTAQVLEELIQLAKDIRAARARGEESGLSREEPRSTTRWPKTRARGR